MDYDFSHIPVRQPTKSLRLNSRWGVRTAYGQLIAMVFVPICVLALVGASIVLIETSRAAKAEQQAQAQAILSRYEPVVRLLTPLLDKTDGAAKATQILQVIMVEEHLNRAAIVDFEGRERVHIGKGLHLGWPDFERKRQFLNGLPSDMGRVYGVRAGLSAAGPLWLMVDMDNEPLRLAQYRVWLALVVTALITILLLLLCLNVYAKRWIAPIYEMRMHLQNTNSTNLYQPMNVVSSGELNMLQRDIVFLLRRLHVSFQELKEYADQTEDDLRNAFDEMELQTISIRNARDAAVSASETKSAFLANISHELRTPLNSIDGFINLLSRRQDLSTEQNMYVQTIRKSSAHLLALVNDVLDFSKIEAGKLVLEQHEVDLYAVIYDVVDMLTPLAAEKAINFVVFYYDDVPSRIIADELRCKQVLTNLVSNALKFTESGEVIVRVSLADNVLPNRRTSHKEQIIVSVQDSGAGVSEADRQHLFKSFSQGDPSITRQYGGTGLGLVISKQLVQLMGGDIGYQDNVAENLAVNGSTFWFSLPVSETLAQPSLPSLDQPLHVMAYLHHEASMKVLSGLVMNMGATLTKATSTADLLYRLQGQTASNQPYDWLVIDGTDDLTALLRGIREHYTGKIAAYGYQVGLDFELLKQFNAQALYQPINRRSLVGIFQDTIEQLEKPVEQWQGKQVLAVDDHMPNLMVLDALLSEQGVSVTTVNSGFDAIDTFNRKNLAGDPFDLIFMDIQMPRMSGFEAASQIRSLEESGQHTPIIALTAHALADERDKLMSAGLDDYVGKPISHPQLVAVLKKWFDAGKTKNNSANIVNELSAVSSSYGRLKALQPNALDRAESQPADVVNHTHALAEQGVTKQGITHSVTQQDTTEHSMTQHSVVDPVTGEVQCVFDWQDALSRSANKADLARDILRLLMESIPSEKTVLREAWDADDIQALGQIAHRIVGGTRYTGVPHLRAVSQRMQQQCIAQQDTEISKAKPALAATYEAMMRALDQLAALDFERIAQYTQQG